VVWFLAEIYGIAHIHVLFRHRDTLQLLLKNCRYGMHTNLGRNLIITVYVTRENYSARHDNISALGHENNYGKFLSLSNE